MKYLIDTHILLWIAYNPDKLSEPAQKIIEDTDNQLLFSAVSMWEIAIKSTLNKDNFFVDARILKRELMEHDYHELPITSANTLEIIQLPDYHKDPFDRLLIAQANYEGILLMTSDKLLAKYSDTILVV